MSVKDPYHVLEGSRSTTFTKTRRDRCVKQIMEETGIGEYEAVIAYRISTKALRTAQYDEEQPNDG